ncbi:39S ribosomal protein L32, mitochondrial [Nasonia vitripennis]|uniref:Large ribosomal subunit protein bL32m n=1 Tax=Nasonia vitripennis TaxID=7425 RepID=A0A7M7H688_NASVI|nr:39S ribosomal protein L32, mitochondrial [Nasonia vitripennis]
MASKVVANVAATFSKFEAALVNIILQKLQPGFCITVLNSDRQSTNFSIKNIWDNGFLWAVPKHRRSLEKRLNRKFGWPKYNWKPLVPKTNLLMCRACGHYHESFTICGHCYEKVKAETLEIQKAMDQQLKLDPVKDDIVVLYEGEVHESTQFWKNQRIVEVPKKRPSWFQQNLLESTTQKLSDSKEIKPNDLA